MQTLQIAFNFVRRKLRLSGLVLTTSEGPPGELWLPYEIPSYLGSDFAERMERYVRRQERKLIRDKLRRDLLQCLLARSTRGG